MVIFWLEERYRKLFGETCDEEVMPYVGCDGILMGGLDNSGVLARIGKQFVLGRRNIWIPKGTEQEIPFVRIDNNSMYNSGLVLTPYNENDVKFHLGTKTIDKRTKLARVELLGADTDDFVGRVFRTYRDSLVLKRTERDKRLVLYEA
ncbi:MAG: hypothetical protein FJY76_02550 [Candidatus Aenigmarchaeota archaeon]|nr:hypothetical protein [Candidatus Aenigmarchaeota archaeon]